MYVAGTIQELRAYRQRELTGSVGFVPTMGFLHEGHLSLIRQARAGNDHVAVSIFVNSRQFNSVEDFSSYPADMVGDLNVLREEGVDLVFTPAPKEVYPPGFSTVISVGPLANVLEGETRPGHFDGVAVVVAKLFNIVQPRRAYFGQKDAQQVAVIRRMVADLNIPVDIVTGDTVRAQDGLALSSRNIHLSGYERQVASLLPEQLFVAQERFLAGERDRDTLLEPLQEALVAEPAINVDYAVIVDADTFELLDTVDRPAILLIAIWVGNTRLIDNVELQ